MQNKCPVCGSTDVKVKDEDGFEFIVCNKCKYDGSSEYDVYPGDKSSGKSKGGSPYKRGGSRRTQK